MIVLDTSGILALLRAKDPFHHAVRGVLAKQAGPRIVTSLVMAEVCYMLEELTNIETLGSFLAGIETGDFIVTCDEDKLPRIRELVTKFADLPLGFSDAAVIACAEARGGKVLSLDRRDFDVVARDLEQLQIYPN